jgi:hypothetical protein
MQVPRIGRCFLASALLAGVCGCLGDAPTIAYAGPRRPPGEIARLSSDGWIRIIGVDGRDYSTRELEILPGAHYVELKVMLRSDELGGAFARTEMRHACYANAKFIAEPGVSYRLVKLSEKLGMRYVREGIHFYHRWGVLLVDEELGDEIPGAVSELNCG